MQQTKKRPHFKHVNNYRITDDYKRKKGLDYYQALDKATKQELLQKKSNHYKERKQKLLESKRAKYQALNETSKQELLTKNINYYKTMEKEKIKIFWRIKEKSTRQWTKQVKISWF